jgi:hypothetical protein
VALDSCWLPISLCHSCWVLMPRPAAQRGPRRRRRVTRAARCRCPPAARLSPPTTASPTPPCLTPWSRSQATFLLAACCGGMHTLASLKQRPSCLLPEAAVPSRVCSPFAAGSGPGPRVSRLQDHCVSWNEREGGGVEGEEGGCTHAPGAQGAAGRARASYAASFTLTSSLLMWMEMLFPFMAAHLVGLSQ